ncbi:MAG: hypothetical protein ACI8UO_005780 [Verrucomicrobiales bacterium]|jgi:hypothetical protein
MTTQRIFLSTIIAVSIASSACTQDEPLKYTLNGLEDDKSSDISGIATLKGSNGFIGSDEGKTIEVQRFFGPVCCLV